MMHMAKMTRIKTNIGTARVASVKEKHILISSYSNLREIPQKKKNVIVFEDSGTENDFGCLWAANMELLDEDWFARYVKSWRWYDDEDGEEDILSQAVKRRDGAFAYA